MKRLAFILSILALCVIVAIWWRNHPAKGQQSSPMVLSSTDYAPTNLMKERMAQPIIATLPEEDLVVAATEKALRGQCIKNLKQIGLAARVWARKNKTNAMPGNEEALKQYLADPENGEKVLRCPGDEKAGYELLSLGASEKDFQLVFASCRIHNNVGLVDGSAHQLDADHKVIQQDGKWIIGR
jgi:hypothetical protein